MFNIITEHSEEIAGMEEHDERPQLLMIVQGGGGTGKR